MRNRVLMANSSFTVHGTNLIFFGVTLLSIVQKPSCRLGYSYKVCG